MKLIKLFLITSMVGLFALVGCDDDTTSSTDAPDPNVFCDEALCATDADRKAQCIETFNYCMENEPDLNDDECIGMALFACRIQ